MKIIGRIIPPPSNAGRGGITHSETMENPTAELDPPQNLWRERTMDFTASVRFDNYSVGAVKVGALLHEYQNGNIQLGEGCEPYRDTPANAAYSNTIKQFLYGEPFRENIILQGTREHSTVASGGRVLAPILHYLGGTPNIDRATQYTPLSGESWDQSWETEVVISLVYGEYGSAN